MKEPTKEKIRGGMKEVKEKKRNKEKGKEKKMKKRT